MSLRFKVPQDVQREDKILFFITLKQLIVLMITGGISYGIFLFMSERYYLSQIAVGVILLPFILGCLFCFVKIKGLGLPQFLLLNVEHLLLPRRRYWQEGSQPLVSSTTQYSSQSKQESPELEMKDVSREKIKNLADLIDNGGKSARDND